MSSVRPKAALGAFLRSRREALSPEDIGLRRGSHRRVGGLRREEVAELCGVSVDYVGRLERGSGPWPSNEVLASLAPWLAPHYHRTQPSLLPLRPDGPAQPSGGAYRRRDPADLDRLDDTPAQVMGHAGTTLRQTPPAVALLGEETAYRGLARSAGYRWFTDLSSRDLYPPATMRLTRGFRRHCCARTSVRYGDGSFTARVVTALLDHSEEFRAVWDRQDVGLSFPARENTPPPRGRRYGPLLPDPASTVAPGKPSWCSPPRRGRKATTGWRC